MPRFRPGLEALEDRYAPAGLSPVATNDGFTTSEDTAVTLAVLGNDSDPENDILTITQINSTAIASGGSLAVTGGTVTLNIDGTLAFAPTANSSGGVSFTYTISDGTTTASATVSGNVAAVNDPPVDDNESVTTGEDTATSGNVLSNAVDVDGDMLTITQFTIAGDATVYSAGNAATIAGVGTLVINPAGSFTFAPADNFNGSVPVATYTLSDGNADTDTSTLTLSVTPANDPPVDGNETITTLEDTPSTGNVLTNASDVDGDTLTVTQFTVAGDVTVYTAGNTATIAGVGTLVILANGSFTFTPAASFNGPVPVATYTLSDANGGTDSSTLSLFVNSLPQDIDESITTLEDTSATGNVLANAVDADGDTLSVTQFTIAGDATTYLAGNTATLTGAGTLVIGADGSFTFTLANNFNGSVPVATYTVSDGRGGTDTSTLTLSITAVNDPPVDGDELVPIVEDATGTGNVLSNATDAEGNTLAVTQFTIAGDVTVYPAGTTATMVGVGTLVIQAVGTFTFTPASNYSGPVPVATYTVSDGAGGTDTSTLTIGITATADAPVDGDESVVVQEDTVGTGNVLSNAVDADGNTLSITQFLVAGLVPIFAPGSSATVTGIGTLILNANGTFSFTPVSNYNGPVPSVIYTLSDGTGNFDTSILTLSVAPGNDAPVDGDEAIVTTEGIAATGNVLTNATDLDAHSLSVTQFTVAGDATVYPAGSLASIAGVGTLVINPNGTFTFTPVVGYLGPVPVATYAVSDGNGGTDTSTLTITLSSATLGRISGFVYHDLNNNGLRDSGEPALTGVEVIVEGRTAAGPITPISAFVDGNGAYDFANLEPGTYRVRQVAQPTGYLDGRETKGNVTLLRGSGTTDVIGRIVLTPGTIASNNNFGEILPSSLSGEVWRDANRNRIRDGLEQVQARVKVVLTGMDDLGRTIRRVVLTDSLGQYRFANVRPGTYAIDVIAPRGFMKAFAVYGTPGGPRAFTNGPLNGIVLTQGVDGIGNNLGLQPVVNRRSLQV